MSITVKLIEQIFKNFKRKGLNVLLIDESKTSKYRIRDENKKRIPNDEAAALIISLRDGCEIHHKNYKTIINKKKPNVRKSEEVHDKASENNDEIDHRLIEIAENVLKGDISLSKSMELIKTSINNNLSY
jgi:hypothetical protein